MKTVFCVFKYALKFFTGCINEMHSCHFLKMWRKQACQRPRTACENNTVNAIFMPFFFSGAESVVKP